MIEELIESRDCRHHKVGVPLLEVAIVDNAVHHGGETIDGRSKVAAYEVATILAIHLLIDAVGVADESCKADRPKDYISLLPTVDYTIGGVLLLLLYDDNRGNARELGDSTECHFTIEDEGLRERSVVDYIHITNPLDYLLVGEELGIEISLVDFPLKRE